MILTFEEARTRVLSLAKTFGVESVAPHESLGRVMVEDTVSTSDMPRFDNSAVDGYAVSLADCGRPGALLSVAGRIQAGGTTTGYSVTAGQCVQVMTGAPIPAGTVAVVMQEDVTLNGGDIVLSKPAQAGKHVRPRGHEFSAGDKVLNAGTVITPPILGGIVALGIAEFPVYKRPKVGLLATGDELAALGDSLSESQIYESNSYGIGAALTCLGIEADARRVKDEPGATVGEIQALTDRCDVVVTSGGVSVGEYDFVRGALCTLGFETVVPRVAVKPGKPFLCAARPSDGKVVFGLPGNPMSALVTFSLFVWPYLALASGRGAPRSFEVELTTALKSSEDRAEFVPARLFSSQGRLVASLEPTVGSHSVAGLAGSDCLVECPMGSETSAGSIVRAWPLPWGCAN